MQVTPRLSIIIVNWNTCDLLKGCLESIMKTCSNLSYEVVVVDNASADGSASMVRNSFPWVKLIVNKDNKGFAKGNNQGYKVSSGKYVMILNPDVIVHPNAFQTMIHHAEKNPSVGAVGSKLLSFDGALQRGYYNRFPTLALMFCHHTSVGKFIDRILFRYFSRQYTVFLKHRDFSTVTPVDQPGATCILLKRELIEKIGLFDESFPIFFNDVDLCKRVSLAGQSIHVVPDAVLTHYGGASLKQLLSSRRAIELFSGMCRYFEKYHGRSKAKIVRLMIIVDMIFRISTLLALLLLGVKGFGRLPDPEQNQRKKEIERRTRFLRGWIRGSSLTDLHSHK